MSEATKTNTLILGIILLFSVVLSQVVDAQEVDPNFPQLPLGFQVEKPIEPTEVSPAPPLISPPGGQGDFLLNSNPGPVNLTISGDLRGDALPASIPQEVHDEVVRNSTIDPSNPSDAYWHWVSAGFSVDVIHAEIIRSRLNGGAGILSGCGILWNVRSGSVPTGFVWKAVSERSGNPVMLVPGSYFGQISKVDLYDLSLGFFANTLLDFGTQRSELQNNGRTHYDFKRRASSYSEAILVVLRRNSRVNECFYITNPRNDYRR